MLCSRTTFIKLRKGVAMGTTKPKKVDRVARYQSMSKAWSQSKFLSSQKCGTKEGRKLQLASFNKTHASSTIKPRRTVQPRNLAGPTEKRRDDMTYKIRVLLLGG